MSFTKESPAFKKRRPAAEEKYRGQCGDEDDVGVFGKEKYGKRDAGVLHVKARDDLRLTLGDIERRPVRFRNAGNQIDKK